MGWQTETLAFLWPGPKSFHTLLPPDNLAGLGLILTGSPCPGDAEE